MEINNETMLEAIDKLTHDFMLQLVRARCKQEITKIFLGLPNRKKALYSYKNYLKELDSAKTENSIFFIYIEACDMLKSTISKDIPDDVDYSKS